MNTSTIVNLVNDRVISRIKKSKVNFHLGDEIQGKIYMDGVLLKWG